MAGAGKKKNKGQYEPLGEFNTRFRFIESFNLNYFVMGLIIGIPIGLILILLISKL